MADKYFGAGGNDSTGDGTLGNPYESKAGAIAGSTAGTDVLVLLDGVNPIADAIGFWVVSQDFKIKGQTSRKAEITGVSGTTYTLRVSPSFSAANSPLIIQGIVVDGTGYDKAISVGNDSEAGITLQLHDMWAKGASDYCVHIEQQDGRQELVNCKLSGSPTKAGFSTGSLVADDGDQAIDIQRMELDLTLSTTGSEAIFVQKDNQLVNDFDLNISGVFGTVTQTGTGSAALMDISGANSPNISGSNITMNADDNTTSFNGIRVRGNTVAVTTSPYVANNKIAYNVPSGFAIAFGVSTAGTAANVIGGDMIGNNVVGKYYSALTPHNYAVFEGTTANVSGNISEAGYVGYLLSKTTTCNMVGNLAYDCYGPSYYVKGTTSATIKNSTAVLSGKYTQRDNGILSVVASSDGTNTAGADFEGNLVIVADVAKIHSLAQIIDSSQVCTYTRNTYIIPDTVDISTELLFAYRGSVANTTLAQWNAGAGGEITDDVIIQMPASQIAGIVSDYKPSAIEGSKGYLISPEHEGYISKIIKWV